MVEVNSLVKKTTAACNKNRGPLTFLFTLFALQRIKTTIRDLLVIIMSLFACLSYLIICVLI